MKGAAVATLVVLLLSAPVSLAATSAPTPAPAPAALHADDTTIGVRHVLSLTPADPGHVAVRAEFDLPESVDRVGLPQPADTTVEATEGFERDGDTLEWDGRTRTPSVTLRRAVNVTVTRGARDGPVDGYLYADVGEWALVRARPFPFWYAATETLTIERDVAVDGPGVAGRSMAFLGEHTVHERTASGQRLRLVVPRAANLSESPETVLGAVGEAAGRLTFGERDPTVTMFAAPTATLSWGTTGLQRGEQDLWVRDVQPVGTAENVWVHEYVHTRQEYDATDATRWTLEASADYYAALLAYESGALGYDGLRRHLREGRATRFEDATLVEPESWEGTLANYVKGALVAGALDRRIRLDSGGNASLQDVFAAAARDDGAFTEAEFLAAVERVGTAETRAFVERYTRTTGAPAVWNRSEHRAAFGPTATFGYGIGTLAVEGPYREGPFDGPVVPGETLSVPVSVSNLGDAPGLYGVTLYAGGERVNTRVGTLDPNVTRTVTVPVPVEPVPPDGRLTLRVGSVTRTVAVGEPATLALTNRSVPTRVREGTGALAAVTLENRADRPGVRSVTFRVDGELVATRTVRLAPGETTTVMRRLRLAPGEHEVAVGGEATTLTVTTPTPTPSATETEAATATGGDGAGFTVAVAVVALALLGLLGLRGSV
jgi:hypothetical protein